MARIDTSLRAALAIRALRSACCPDVIGCAKDFKAAGTRELLDPVLPVAASVPRTCALAGKGGVFGTLSA